MLERCSGIEHGQALPEQRSGVQKCPVVCADTESLYLVSGPKLIHSIIGAMHWHSIFIGHAMPPVTSPSKPTSFGSDVLCFIGENPGLETSRPGLFFGVK
ncbi:MAG: hypothetical protein IT262_12435 [Saprospiraceae bacterium]|nr:hypothetical protein [Saprospiraceae bacterium]